MKPEPRDEGVAPDDPELPQGGFDMRTVLVTVLFFVAAIIIALFLT
jgi:hypothetical protein